MDRQLFSHAASVSAAPRVGAVPFSVAVHALAIAGIALAAGTRAKAIEVSKPLPTLTFRVEPGARAGGPASTPAPAPAQARRNTRPPQRSTQGAMPAPTAAPVATAAPSSDSTVAFTESSAVVDPTVPAGEASTGDANTTVGNCIDCPATDGPSRPDGGSIGDGDRRGALPIGGRVLAPRRVHGAPPNYPPIARQAGITGVVVLECVIGPDGRVREARVTSGNPIFHREALQAVRQWQYTRPTLNEQPISVLMTVTVQFVLDGRSNGGLR